MKGPCCSTCLTPYMVSCPIHPSVNSDGAGLPECRMEWCSPQKHIQVCNCKPDVFWDFYGLVDPDSNCCMNGVCTKHVECEIHGTCPNRDGGDDDDDEECRYRWVGQCCTYLMNRKGDKQGRCPNDLDGVADSRVCPDCVRLFYPMSMCPNGCGEPRRIRYDSMAGAWITFCPCDECSSSVSAESENRKKQKNI